jgi:hypothetical protein
MDFREYRKYRVYVEYRVYIQASYHPIVKQVEVVQFTMEFYNYVQFYLVRDFGW